MWGIILSDPLSIVDLVSRYLANYLIERMPIVHRVATFNKYSDAGPLFYAVLFKVSSDYPPVNGRLHTRYAPVRRSPSTGIATRYAAPRLACVRPAASVYPEPGSNSPLSNPSPDSLLKSTSPLLYTPLPIFFLRYYRSAIGSGYLIFSKNSLAHGQPLSLHPLSHPGPSPFAGAKVIPFSFSIQIFFKVFLKKFFKTSPLPGQRVVRCVFSLNIAL